MNAALARWAPLPWVLVGATGVVGVVAGALQIGGVAVWPWFVGGWAVLTAVWRVVRMLADLRSHRWGVDVLAVLAVASTLVVAEWWAAWVITLMMTGGDALEEHASRRAHGEIRALMERAPRRALRLDDDGTAHDVPAGEVEVGDVVLVRPGDIAPVDGVLLDDHAAFDLSSLTGESLPATSRRGDRVPSGAIATTSPARLRCTAAAGSSEYQRIVDAVGAAAGSRSRFVRLSDRISVPFTIAALAIAGVAWAVSGQFLRFAEVLVVATPCPLLIAAPAAFVAGMGRAARAGVVLKNAEALERVAAARSAAFDKTGTLTTGAPELMSLVPDAGVDPDELLGLAAAAESSSSHALAGAVVRAAAERHLRLPEIRDVEERAGEGVVARSPLGQELRVGSAAFAGGPSVDDGPGTASISATLDRRPLGRIVLRDPVRPDARATLAGLRAEGIERIVMLTGDAEPAALGVAGEVGITEVHALLRPEQKASLLAGLAPRPTLMVGDGINDVLVLASADVGVALNRAGLGAVGESADAVVVSGRLGALLDVRRIARRTRRIARESVWLGVLASLALMAVATTGVLPPIVGALAQEAVDVATILNALRATRSAAV